MPWDRGRERLGAGEDIQRRGVTRQSAWWCRRPGMENYLRSISRTLFACAAKSRNAALMLETWNMRNSLHYGRKLNQMVKASQGRSRNGVQLY